MLKLYRLSETKKEYWETWEESKNTHTVHWGELGTRGETKTIKSTKKISANELIQQEISILYDSGFSEIEAEDHARLMIEYKIDGMGDVTDIDKRHRLEDRMNETLGWTGLGACDGGSVGSGTMEVCNFVVDFELAKKIVIEDLKDTEFENYTRIYNEDVD